jgi:membrane protein DedA with SNARE-associated domain
VFEWLHDVASSPWFYAVIVAIALADSVVPVVPSETTVIVGGVTAGLSPPGKSLLLVILCGAIGAFIGDNLAYLLGRRAGPWIHGRAKEKGKSRLSWAEQQLKRRGGLLLITARFVPGGRTAITVSSGVTHQPHPRFALFVGIAAIIWATYAATLGYLGGAAFEDSHTTAFLVAFGAALSVTMLVEIGRWLIHRRRPQVEEAEDAPAEAA